MAKQIWLRETGTADVLKIESVPTPEPNAGEVRIRVKAIGLNRAEVNLRAGTYGKPPKLPLPIGLEAAGTIDAIGAGVAELKVGDAVSIAPAFDTSAYGMYGDQVVAPARAVVKHPDNISWEEAAATWMSFTTAWAGLVDYARLASEDFVVISAASSSVGLSAIQLAHQAGAKSIALTRTKAKVQALRDAGASHVAVTESEDVAQAVLKITDQRGARVIFDAVGGKAFSSLVAAAATNGIIVAYGALSKEENVFSVIQVIRKKLTVRGIASTGMLHDDLKLEALKAYVTSGLKSGDLRPIIAKSFPFDQIADAHRYIESGDQFGKVVLTV
jgi:NADPH:quinone reductase-like Zn-dependent oxidoreductase